MNILKLINSNLTTKLIGVYTKGKADKGYRFLVEYTTDSEYHKTGEQELLFFDEHFVMGINFNYIPFTLIKPGHLKFKNYNYYELAVDPEPILIQELERYKKGRKLFWTGTLGVFDTTYRPTFEFNGIQY